MGNPPMGLGEEQSNSREKIGKRAARWCENLGMRKKMNRALATIMLSLQECKIALEASAQIWKRRLFPPSPY